MTSLKVDTPSSADPKGRETFGGQTYAEMPLDGKIAPLKVDFFLPAQTQRPAPVLVWLGADVLSKTTAKATGPRILADFLTSKGVALAVPEVRVGADRADLPNTVVERLSRIEPRRDTSVDPKLSTFPALAATEDLCALLAWIEVESARLGLSGKTVLAGASTGAGLAFNVGVVAPHLGLYRPDPDGVISYSGTCPWPSLFPANFLRAFALHNPTDRRTPIGAVRAMAHLDPRFELIESIEQAHGSLGLWPQETMQDACNRILARVLNWCSK